MEATDTRIVRPSWEDYYMNIAREVAKRSNCVRRKVGAVIVRENRIISTGYNGTPRGTKNCDEGGCPRCAGNAPSGTGLDECLCSHAEENAIVQSAYHGISVKDGTLYSTLQPCLTCTKMIINSGISHLFTAEKYSGTDAASKLLLDSPVFNIDLYHITHKKVSYDWKQGSSPEV